MSDPEKLPNSRRRVACVLALALAVRVAVGVWRGSALLESGNGLSFMHDLAQALVAGDGYTLGGVPSVFHQPGYIFALAAGYAVTGPNWVGVLLVGATLGTALVAVVMRVARHVGPRAVIPAGLMAALHPILVWHGMSVADTTLFSLALLGWVEATLASMRRPGWKPLVAAGLWLGLAFLTRPSLLPLIPFGALAVWWVDRSWRRTLRYAVVSLVIGMAIALPWALRNQRLTGEFPLLGTHGPESVWAANTDESVRATELDSTYDAVSALYAGTEFDVLEFQVDLTPEESVRRAAHFRDSAAEWMRAHVGTFLGMCVVRFGRIWDVRYHPTRRWDKPIPGVLERNRVHLAVQTPIVLLALCGLVLLLSRRESRPEALFLLAVLLVYTGSHCVGAGYTRVRVPVDPVLVVLAASALAYAPFPGRSARSGGAGSDRADHRGGQLGLR